MRKNIIFRVGILVLTFILCACGTQAPVAPPEEPAFQDGVTRLPKLGELEAKELLKYKDGIVEIEYDGNVFIPVGVDMIADGLFELLFASADVEDENSMTYGYFVYGLGSFDVPDIEEIYAEEIGMYIENPEEQVKETEDYRPKTDDEIFRIFKWEIDGTNGYGFIRISNVEGECVIAQFFSEHEDVIKDKALKMVESFKLTGTEELDEKSFDESFARTDAIYEKFFPEEMAAYREELEANEEAMENGAYLDAPTTEEIIDNSAANGKTLAFDEFEVQMETGDEYDLTLIGTAAEDGVEYVSSNPEVVTTDQNGHIKAVGAGDAAIIAYTDYGAVAKAYIFVLEGKEAAK